MLTKTPVRTFYFLKKGGIPACFGFLLLFFAFVQFFELSSLFSMKATQKNGGFDIRQEREGVIKTLYTSSKEEPLLERTFKVKAKKSFLSLERQGEQAEIKEFMEGIKGEYTPLKKGENQYTFQSQEGVFSLGKEAFKGINGEIEAFLSGEETPFLHLSLENFTLTFGENIFSLTGNKAKGEWKKANDNEKPVFFSADSFKKEKEIWFFYPPFSISQEGFGMFTNHYQVKVQEKWENMPLGQKAFFPFPFQALGKSEFFWTENPKSKFRVQVDGEISTKENGYEIFLKGNKEPLRFDSDWLQMEASEAVLTYKKEGEFFHLDTIHLEGDVKVYKELFLEGLVDSQLVRAALADSIDIHVSDREGFLSATKKKVLFYDDLHQLWMSAPKVRLSKDATGKETFQGLGHVRFELKEQEMEKVKNAFKQFK